LLFIIVLKLKFSLTVLFDDVIILIFVVEKIMTHTISQQNYVFLMCYMKSINLNDVVFRESLRFLLFFHCFIKSSWYSDHSKSQNYTIEYLAKTYYVGAYWGAFFTDKIYR